MRKFTLLVLLTALGFAGFAQRASQKSLINPDVRQKADMIKHQSHALRAIGDTIWYNDLGTPSDWSIYNLNSTTYDWVIGTAFPSGPYSSGQTISSTTVANGFAMFDSDNYGDFAIDACIEYANTIDCSTYGNVTVRAQQSYRYYSAGSLCYVEVSTDGTNWTQYPINTGVASGSTEENPFEVNISATAANQATVHIRIRWAGQWEYAWMFDDIVLVVGADYELVGQGWVPSFYGAGWYSKMPKSNHTALTLLQVPIFNNGSQTLTGLNMTATIDDETSTQVYNQTTTTTTSGNTDIAAAALDTLYDDIAFDPDTTAYHYYTINMSVGMNETDENPSNNALANPYHFEINDLSIQRANGMDRWLGTYGYSGSVSGDVMGTIFYLPNNDTVGSIDVPLHADATTALNADASIQGMLYMDDGSGNWVQVIGTNNYDITVADTASAGHMVNLPFQLDGFSEIITGGSWYFVGIIMNLDPTTEVIQIGAEQLFPHDFQNSVNITVGGTWYYTTSGVPDITLNMLHVVGVNTQQTKTGVSIYPNPASTEIHVDNAAGSTIKVYNLMGQDVMTVNDANAFNTLNVESLSAGTYVVKVINDNQVKTTKINIVK